MTEYWIEVRDRHFLSGSPIAVLGPFDNRKDADDARVPYLKNHKTFLYTKENDE